MPRFTAQFYIVSSSTGYLISKIKATRSGFAGGPFVRVESSTACLTKEQGDKFVADGKLYVPKTINRFDFTESRHLKVKMVTVSSYDEPTTRKMLKFYFAASKLEIYTVTLDVAAIVGRPNAQKVVAMTIGRGSQNLHAIVKKQAKVFTKRKTSPYVFQIHAYTMKDMLAVKIRLEKAIRKIKEDLEQKELLRSHSHTARTTPVLATTASQNPFADLEDDEDDEDEMPPEMVVHTIERGGDHPPIKYTDDMPVDSIMGPACFPKLTATDRPKSVVVDPHETIAAKLQDAAARGETFTDHALPDDDDDDDDDEMPKLITAKGMTAEQIFAAAIKSSAIGAGWGEEY